MNLFVGLADSKAVMHISFAVIFACRISLAYVIADWIGVWVFGTWIATFVDWYVRSALFV